MPSALTIRAGSIALERLRDGGFDPEAVATLVGASGGPKWLVLSQIDRVVATEVIAPRRRPLAVVGSSIGTYRHLCLAQPDAAAAIARFEEAYVEQAYEREPTPAGVSESSVRILDTLFGATGRERVLDHPLLHTHIVAVRSRRPVASDHRVPLSLGLGAAAIGNAIDRRLLAAFFERAVFHTRKPAIGFRGFSTQNVPLTAENLDAAVLASGSIPLVMEGVDDLRGARPGRYRDGGIVDYHFDFEFDAPEGLLLYPHFFDRITPGWFDKFLRWRRPRGAALARTILISPSTAFLARLPGGRVPDRGDFRALSTNERQARWRAIVDRCRELADELADLLATGRLGAAATSLGDATDAR